VRADGDAWEEAAAGVEFIDENGGGPGARLKKNPLAQHRRRSKKVAEPARLSRHAEEPARPELPSCA
jgi:hypothetical protein